MITPFPDNLVLARSQVAFPNCINEVLHLIGLSVIEFRLSGHLLAAFHLRPRLFASTGISGSFGVLVDSTVLLCLI